MILLFTYPFTYLSLLKFYIVLQFEVTGLETAAIILQALKKHCIGTN